MATVTGFTAEHVTALIDGLSATTIEVGDTAGGVLSGTYPNPTFANAMSTEATRTASGKGFVNHGSDAGIARPSGYASIEWVGSVAPTNAVDGDTWVNTA